VSEVVVLQHAAAEAPGAIGDALRRHEIRMRIVRIDQDAPVPGSLGGAAGLVIMGGPMSVYDRDRIPHLSAELRLIERALSDGVPILRVCLGSQLLAAALGARVYSSGRKEIGWHEIRLREAALSDPLWHGIEGQFTAFHWHGDIFELPNGATPLASSPMTELQAFRSGTNAYGLLFHLEVGKEQVREMVTAFADELEATRIPPGPILGGLERHGPGVERIGTMVFDRWAQRVASGK
jgi:GMP synthase (glutamine-hydrolysing)